MSSDNTVLPPTMLLGRHEWNPTTGARVSQDRDLKGCMFAQDTLAARVKAAMNPQLLHPVSAVRLSTLGRLYVRAVL